MKDVKFWPNHEISEHEGQRKISEYPKERKKIDVANQVLEMRKSLNFLVEYWMLEDDGAVLSNS